MSESRDLKRFIREESADRLIKDTPRLQSEATGLFSTRRKSPEEIKRKTIKRQGESRKRQKDAMKQLLRVRGKKDFLKFIGSVIKQGFTRPPK